MYKAVEVSIRVRDARAIGTIAGALALLRIPSSGKWTADVYRLAEIRNRCWEREPCSSGTHSIAIVRDRGHLAAIREARDTAESEIFAVCDLMGPAGETSVFVPSRAAAKVGVSVTLVHDKLARSVSAGERDRAAAALSEFGIRLMSAENVHGKFMTWDDKALLITSFNWLATTPDPWKPRGAEIGIIVKGPGLAAHLRKRFCELAGVQIEPRHDPTARAVSVG
jgi:hypothetical protein